MFATDKNFLRYEIRLHDKAQVLSLEIYWKEILLYMLLALLLHFQDNNIPVTRHQLFTAEILTCCNRIDNIKDGCIPFSGCSFRAL